MASLRPVLEEMEAAAGGPGKWLAIYGGDPCGRKALLGVPSAAADGADDGAFTIGDLMRAVKAEFSPALLAVSSPAADGTVAAPGGHVDFQYRFQGGAAGGSFGGVDKETGDLLGATAVYLGPGARRALGGVVCVGGGEQSCQEVMYAAGRGLPWRYVRAASGDAPDVFGPVDDWVRGGGL